MDCKRGLYWKKIYYFNFFRISCIHEITSYISFMFVLLQVNTTEKNWNKEREKTIFLFVMLMYDVNGFFVCYYLYGSDGIQFFSPFLWKVYSFNFLFCLSLLKNFFFVSFCWLEWKRLNFQGLTEEMELSFFFNLSDLRLLEDVNKIFLKEILQSSRSIWWRLLKRKEERVTILTEIIFFLYSTYFIAKHGYNKASIWNINNGQVRWKTDFVFPLSIFLKFFSIRPKTPKIFPN